MSEPNAVAGPSKPKGAFGGIATIGIHSDTIDKSNPRGIPYAPFVTNVDDFVGGQDAGVEGIMGSFKEMTSKYQYMEVSLQTRRKGIESKIPDIAETLKVVKFLEARRCKSLGTQPTVVPKDSNESDEEQDDEDALSDEPESEDEDDLLAEANELEASDEQLESGKVPGQKALKTLYELNDTLFAEAEVEENGQVGLWLGANTMLMYPLGEAVLLLSEKLSTAKKNLNNIKEDLEFLREQVTVMEVNFARVHNVSLSGRRLQKEGDQGKKGEHVKSLKDQD
ncbi:hypothetical protein FFLO_04598 [Filobasidium floriforme]|uniref:Prefoldin subunit 3 n=1 Tax=Filobasidium floriforme TaxID=5210 RepID=A0A8K0NPN8_9TREE|nr:hypothetical protein FFLO_04598 [Filobasidium floriforme]